MAQKPLKRERIDVLLVERGHAQSRERARALVLAGRVYLGEQRIEKAGDLVALEAEITLRGDDLPFVSRGGVKLAGALDAFALEVRGFVAADIGASTGGFTDCLLQRGALRVYAIDVGYGQLHESLRRDARVINMERTNARHLADDALPEKVDLVVIDASFIGLAKLLPSVTKLLKDEGELVAMVKPQFEVGRAALKKGVVRDEVARLAAIDGVAASALALGFRERARADSVLPGPDGNREAFLRLARTVDARTP